MHFLLKQVQIQYLPLTDNSNFIKATNDLNNVHCQTDTCEDVNGDDPSNSRNLVVTGDHNKVQMMKIPDSKVSNLYVCIHNIWM